MSETPNSVRTPVLYRYRGAAGALGVALLVTAGIATVRSYERMPNEYLYEYVYHDGCLQDTGYDPSHGATLSIKPVGDDEVLVVKAGDDGPNISLQQAEDDKIVPSDPITGTILAKAGCELPSGT